MDAGSTMLVRIAVGIKTAERAEVDFGHDGPSSEQELVAKCDVIFKEMATHTVVIYWKNGENTWNVRNLKALCAHFNLPQGGNKIVRVVRLSIKELNKYLPQE